MAVHELHCHVYMTLSSNRRTPGCLREVAGRAVLTSYRECVVVIWIGMWTVRQRTRAVQRRATGARASSFGEKLERRKGGDKEKKGWKPILGEDFWSTGL